MLERGLKWIADFQIAHPTFVLVLCILITLAAFNGAMKIKSEANMEKWMPQDLPVIKTSKLIRSIFGASDMEMVVVRLDPDSTDEYAISDVRDPEVLEAIDRLELRIRDEDHVYSVMSLVDYIKIYNGGTIPVEIKGVKQIINAHPELKEYIASDYSSTIIMITTDAGADQNVAKRLTRNIEHDISESAFPSGIRADVTGIPSLVSTIMDLINENNRKTTTLSMIFVLLLLIISYSSIRWGLKPMVPLAFGVVWMMGLMGYLGIPLNMATSVVTSMMIGIGIAYGVHIVDRYKEERAKGMTVDDAVETSVVKVGSAIISTSATTMGGFIALIFGSMPMMQQMGEALFLCIGCSMASAIFLLPSILCLLDRRDENAS